MKTLNTTVYATKDIHEVPFKMELLSKDTKPALLFAAGNKKTYPEFIRDCKDPDLLMEVIHLKKDEPHFPSRAKIVRVAIYSAIVFRLVEILVSTKRAKRAAAAVLKLYIPRNQYAL